MNMTTPTKNSTPKMVMNFLDSPFWDFFFLELTARLKPERMLDMLPLRRFF